MMSRGSEALKQSSRSVTTAHFNVLPTGGTTSRKSGGASYAAAADFFPSALPVRLHVRTELHLMRKVWHVVMGCLAAFLYLSGMPTATAVTILATLMALSIVMETVRLKLPTVNEKVMRVWAPFMRETEVNRVSGMPYYIASMLIAIAIFPKPVAILSILYLACGDPIASLFGIAYGHKSIRMASGKSLIGTAAGVITCAIVTFVFLKTLAISGPALLALPVVGGLAGGTAELLPFEVDDNFSIPIVSGFVLWFAFIALGI